VYHAGVLQTADITAIRFPSDELAGFAFVVTGEVSARVRPLVARRIAVCLDPVATGTEASLENGYVVG
jgi:hypothetical protein